MDREILSVKTRKDLYDFVRKNPGFHLRELSRALNLSITLADYHLRFLEKHELITSAMDGEYKRFYPRSTPGQAEVRAALTEAEKQILAFLRQPVPLKVIDFLMEREGATHKEILDQVPVSPSTLSHDLKKMQGAGVVVHIRHDDRRVVRHRRPADGFADRDPQVQGRAGPGPGGEDQLRSVHVVDPDPRVMRNLTQLPAHEVRDRLALAPGVDDLLEASGDLVVTNLALFAGHDFAELPDSFHRGAPLRRTAEVAIRLAEFRDKGFATRYRLRSRNDSWAGSTLPPNRMMKCSNISGF